MTYPSKKRNYDFPVDFTEDDLPSAYPDDACGDNTQAAINCVTSVGWPKQAAGANGDQIINQVENHGNATVINTVGWADGFIFTSTDLTEGITLPADFIMAADEAERLLIFVIRHDVQVTGGGGGVGIISSDDASTGQYSLYANKGMVGQDAIVLSGPGNEYLHTYIPDAAPAVYLNAFHFKKIISGADTGKYQIDAIVGSKTAILATPPAIMTSTVVTETALPTGGTVRVGRRHDTTNDWRGKFLYAFSDWLIDGRSALQTCLDVWDEHINEWS